MCFGSTLRVAGLVSTCPPATADADAACASVFVLQVLCRVTVQGKGYLHPDGRVAVSGIRLDQLLQYVPKGPTDKVVSSLSYDDAIGRASIRTAGVTLVEQQQQRESRTGRPPAVQLVRQLEEAAWDVEEA